MRLPKNKETVKKKERAERKKGNIDSKNASNLYNYVIKYYILIYKLCVPIHIGKHNAIDSCCTKWTNTRTQKQKTFRLSATRGHQSTVSLSTIQYMHIGVSVLS